MTSLSKTSCKITWDDVTLSTYILKKRIFNTTKWIDVGVYNTKSCIVADFSEHWIYEVLVRDSKNENSQEMVSFISLHGYVNIQ